MSAPNQGRSPVFRGPMKAVAAGKHVYVRNGDGQEELFDIEADPMQSATSPVCRRFSRSSIRSGQISTSSCRRKPPSPIVLGRTERPRERTASGKLPSPGSDAALPSGKPGSVPRRKSSDRNSWKRARCPRAWDACPTRRPETGLARGRQRHRRDRRSQVRDVAPANESARRSRGSGTRSARGRITRLSGIPSLFDSSLQPT